LLPQNQSRAASLEAAWLFRSFPQIAHFFAKKFVKTLAKLNWVCYNKKVLNIGV
jgi:hypothetical protein